MLRSLMLLTLVLSALAQDSPRLFLSADQLAAAQERAARQGWAKAALDGVVNNAKAWPQSHLTKYGLKTLELPPEGGQWTLWDVCPVHGVHLRYTPPATKTCPLDNKQYSGWPYDQVTYDRRLDDLANAARDLALAYRWTGERAYAEQSAWILKEKARKYLTYALHDKDNKTTRSGARMHSQTLDESVWLLPVAWAYDLLRGVDVFTPEERAEIENNLLREAVKTIQRNDAGMSNWQSWHNAAIGAVGFALGDEELIRAAIDGKSGFRYQMANSVTPDGFWYEGAWGYHFYALDPLLRLATMAGQGGYDLFSSEPLKKMFDAPLYMVLPSGNLPAFNDSKEVNLYGYDTLYEYAYARYGEQQYAAVLGRRTRGLNALLFGAEEAPPVAIEGLRSAALPESGYVILRAPEGDHTVAMKYGPHGGGHGHYDKLNFVSFANGATQALDPGTQSYAAPTHGTWDKLTIAHNTVTVDETVQAEATGRLEWADLDNETYRAARASGGTAYKQARLARTMLMTGEYALDVFEVEAADGQPHTIDWAYHNDGTAEAAAPLAVAPFSGFPQTNGYQNITATQSAAADADWQVSIDQTQGNFTVNISVYNSNSSVAGTAAVSRDQSVSAPFSAKLGYNFSGAGYELYSVAPSAQKAGEAPAGVSVWLYGDGSGHRVAFRLNDATDERFVTPAIVVNWTGWKQFEFIAPESWSHYLGNADGRLDLPVKSFVIEFTNAGGEAPKTGAIYVDDVSFKYAEGDEVTAVSFDPEKRKMRLWMLGESGTEVVLGRGLSTTLPNTAACVVARRRAQQTAFVTLLEPYRDLPGIVSFSRDGEGRFVVEGAGFRDTFRLEADGVKEFTRTR
ncbi:MAG: heparinase II/III family protein [Acidobacteria bacterium]|nr:heparinase II/III family protein [Acidobacteriota bacterium]